MGLHRMSVAVEEDVLNEIKQSAEDNFRSINKEIEYALRVYLKVRKQWNAPTLDDLTAD